MTKTRKNVLGALVGGAALLLAMQGQAQEWPRFRGPNGTGVSPATTVPARITPSDVNWRVALPGSGHSSPVLWGDKLFLTSAEPNRGQRHLLCLHAATGKTLWTRSYPFQSYQTHRFNSAASATPATDAQRVYITWPAPDSFLVIALTHAGREVWRRDLGPYQAQHGGAASPIVMDDLLILGKEPEEGEGGLYALDCKTGAIRWRRDRYSKDAVYATPMVYRPNSGPPELIFASTSHGLTSLNPKTGTLNWEARNLFQFRCVGSPVQVGSLLFATAGNGGGGREAVAVRPGSKRANTPASVAYQVRRGSSYVPTPIVLNNRLFFWGDNGIVTCVRADTGETVWSERVGGNFFGSPVGIQGRLYAMSAAGELVVIAAADTFQVLSRYDLGEPSHATPAVANGTLYLRTESHLLSIGGTKTSRK